MTSEVGPLVLAPSVPAPDTLASPEVRVASGPETQAAAPDPPTKPKLAFLLAHKWLILLGIAALGAALWATYSYLGGTQVAVVTVRRGDLVETVVASGHVESRFRVDISSQMIGTVARVAVQEGETVRAGQTLLVLGSGELASASAQARGVVAQAQAQMRRMRELSLPTAREAERSAAASLRGTQQIYDRTAILMRKGFLTRAQFDDAQKNLDMARAQLATASAQVAGARAGGSDYALAQSQLGQASAGYAAATSRLAYTTIVAPRDGVLISRSVEQGTVVTPGQVLMVLAPAGGVQLVMQIDERNLGKLAVGQPALASADAYPGQRFAATIAFINPGIDIARASATVKLAVANPPPYLRQDMTVSVDIETARRKAALVLPIAAVHDVLTTSPWVLVVQGGRAVRRSVTLGLLGNLQVQILSGLAVGDAVVLTASAIAAGARVHAAVP
jgi:HlyD family secretion protein